MRRLPRARLQRTRPASTQRRPTTWWHCGSCGQHINRYRGTSDQSCTCGAQYNAAGQRLRDDWMNNPAWRDDELGDMEGYELACLAKETRSG